MGLGCLLGVVDESASASVGRRRTAVGGACRATSDTSLLVGTLQTAGGTTTVRTSLAIYILSMLAKSTMVVGRSRSVSHGRLITPFP